MTNEETFADRVGMRTLYVVTAYGSKAGAIGAHGTERRTYEIEASDPSFINDLAISLAHAEGLEHVKVSLAKRKESK